MRLIADIGGTNARFSLSEGGGYSKPVILPVAGHERFTDAMTAFLEEQGGIAVASCAVAAAGPVVNGAVRLTNAHWTVDGREIADRLGCPVAVLNDLEAVGCALPYLARDHLHVLREGGARTRAPMIAVNVGTGFGASVAVPAGDGWVTLPTEPGHMLLPEAGMTVEHVLTGRSLARMKRDGTVDALDAFSRTLGRVTRDLVLATGAWGGVRFCGGVLATWEENVDTAAFLDTYDIDGPMKGRLAEVSLARIVHPHPALFGLLHARIGSEGGIVP